MSSDRKLISAILARGEITPALEQGITESIFTDPASQKAFHWIFRYYVKYRIVPKKERFKRQFPEFRLLKVYDEEPFDDICEELMSNVRYRFTIESLREIAQMMDDEDPNVYDHYIKTGMQLAGITSLGDMVKVRDMQKRIDVYQKNVDEQKSPYGIKFGLPTIDKLTFGMQAGDLITIAARLGTGKSNLLKHVCKTAFFDHKNIIVFSMEESRDLFQRRFDAMLSDLPYQELKSYSLSKEDIKRWRENAKKFVEDFDNEVAVISGLKRMTPETVLSYIERYKPDLVAVDGMHLLRSGNGGGYSVDWQKITSIMDEMKQMALFSGIPIIGVVQANRTASKEGVSVDTISFADSIGQLCDVVIGIWQNKEMEEGQVASLSLAKNRDGPRAINLTYRWKLGPDKIDIHELTEKEVKELGIFDDEED